jgi:hypothetical protein|eukprot:COSAG01_NODE_22711_length_844_cov_5.851007_1_plen_89_part_00
MADASGLRAHSRRKRHAIEELEKMYGSSEPAASAAATGATEPTEPTVATVATDTERMYQPLAAGLVRRWLRLPSLLSQQRVLWLPHVC